MTRNRTNEWHALATIAVLFSLTTTALAQPTGAVTFEFPLQTTSGPAADSESSRNLAGSVVLEQWFSSDRAHLFYYASLDRFRTTESFATWLHNAGAARTFTVDKTTVDLAGSLFWRANTGSWADAGFHGVNLQSSIERTLSTGTVSTAYNVYRRGFSEAPELDQLEHFVSTRALRNFQTKTTVTGIAGAGWKKYAGETSPARRRLWMWSARVAQSLTDRTGVWLEREERRPDGDAPPALVWTPPLFYDDGVYDDPYVVDARTWRMGVRHSFARGDELAYGIDRSNRTFDGLYVASPTDGPVREDTLLRTGLEAAIVLRSTRLADLVLSAGYGYVWNDSNDEGQAYRTHVTSLGLSLRF